MTPLVPRVGISRCLLGSPVRYDGGHRLCAFAKGQLGPLVQWVPVCPEVEVGMSVPRETVRLVGRGGGGLQMISQSGVDWTDKMNAFAAGRAEQLAALGLDGYIFKRGSPSCGVRGVSRHVGDGSSPMRDARGLFAAQLLARLPGIAISQEDWLLNPIHRRSFLARLFAHAREKDRRAAGLRYDRAADARRDPV